jgi:hypothetical protein
MTNWDDIKVGDFFVVNIMLEDNTLLYQKIAKKNDTNETCNAVLLNTGELCNIYVGSESKYKKVDVAFDIK